MSLSPEGTSKKRKELPEQRPVQDETEVGKRARGEGDYETREGIDYRFNAEIARTFCRGRKSYWAGTSTSHRLDSSYYSEEGKSSEDSVVSPGETDFDKTLREYKEHLKRVDDSREMWDMHLTFDEFLCQQPIDEHEFGPDEDIWSIR